MRADPDRSGKSRLLALQLHSRFTPESTLPKDQLTELCPNSNARSAFTKKLYRYQQFDKTAVRICFFSFKDQILFHLVRCVP